MSQQKIRWGIMGCGRIARKFATDLQLVDDAVLTAVASRDMVRAKSFADEFHAEKFYDQYEQLASSGEVDVIYVATPHALHYENTLLCLRNNKAVLCEKAFAINHRQAKEMIDLAREKKIFLMEALWTKFLPHYNKLMELLGQEILGDIKNVSINFGFIPGAPISHRLFNPSLGGGSLLDIGIYNVFMTLAILGKPAEIEASMSPSRSGVDEQCAMLFKYANGTMAQLFSSFAANLPTEAEISGTKGRIKLTTRFYEPSAEIQYYTDVPATMRVIPINKEKGLGYQYEARHVNECLKKGLTESPVMTHADTLLLMETLDMIRAKAGIKYPVDIVDTVNINPTKSQITP